jgi:hypothetical protein
MKMMEAKIITAGFSFPVIKTLSHLVTCNADTVLSHRFSCCVDNASLDCTESAESNPKYPHCSIKIHFNIILSFSHALQVNLLRCCTQYSVLPIPHPSPNSPTKFHYPFSVGAFKPQFIL